VTDDFIKAKPRSQFDQAFMQALFAHAEALAARGYPWSKTPPGLTEALSGSLNKFRDAVNGSQTR